MRGFLLQDLIGFPTSASPCSALNAASEVCQQVGELEHTQENFLFEKQNFVQNIKYSLQQFPTATHSSGTFMML